MSENAYLSKLKLGDISRPRQWPTINQDLVKETGKFPVYGANGIIGFFNKSTHINPTIAVTCRGSTCGEVSITSGPAYITGNAMAIDELNEDLVNTRYLFHFIKNDGLKDFITGSAQPQIVGSAIREFEVITPPLPEQRKISQILDALDTQIQKTEALIAKLEKIKEGLLHDLLTRGIDQSGQLRPTPEQAPELYKESALGLIPKRWEVRSIAESGVKLIDGDRGANYPSDQDFTTGSGYCIFLSAKNVTRSGFRFDTRQFISKDKDRVLGTGKLVRNDVIVTTRGTVGNFAHYSHSIPYDNIRINSGMLILRGAESNLIPEFLYLSLKEHLFHRENGKKGSGSAQPQLPARDFESFLLVIPDQEEQQEIIELASVQNQRIKAENDEIQKLTSLKAALMDDLLTGRVQVTPLLANS